MTGLSLEVNLIDELLAEQQRLTPVERFAKRHDRADFPAQAHYYRDLIPSVAACTAAAIRFCRRPRRLFRLQGLCECLPFAEWT